MHCLFGVKSLKPYDLACFLICSPSTTFALMEGKIDHRASFQIWILPACSARWSAPILPLSKAGLKSWEGCICSAYDRKDFCFICDSKQLQLWRNHVGSLYCFSGQETSIVQCIWDRCMRSAEPFCKINFSILVTFDLERSKVDIGPVQQPPGLA